MELGRLDADAAVLGVDAPHAFDLAERRQIDRCPLRRQLDEMIGADRSNERRRRATSDDLAVVHDGELVAEPLGLVHVVGGQQDRPPGFLELLDEIPQLAARLRIETGRRLVEEEQIGLADERARQRQPLFLAA